jgi:glycerol-3-phosphate cytidylyltransferase
MIIGYTSGVYDLFHIGHLNVLKKAKSQCDHLIVAVTTDELSVARKAKAPVIPLAERMAIVSELRCVDQVVKQEDMNKFGAWERFGFHRMFVGDDWKGDPKWVDLEQRFAPHGVEIIYFPYTTHTSSTKLREALDVLTAVRS